MNRVRNHRPLDCDSAGEHATLTRRELTVGTAALALGAAASVLARPAAALAQATPAAAGEGPTIVFLGESSAADIIWGYRVERMQEEADRLGVDFSFRFAEGDYARHAEMIEEETARGVDAIIAPFWDASIYNAAIEDAATNGVFVYGLLGIEPRNEFPEEVVEQLGWVDIDQIEWGREMARVAIDRIPDGANVFWPAEVPSGTYITEAVKGFEEYYAEQGKTVNIEVAEVTNDPTTATQRITAYLLGHPDTDAVITSGAIAINAANIAVKEMGLEPGEIPLIGQVISPASSLGIMEGYMPVGINLELTESSFQALRDANDVATEGIDPPKRSIGFAEVTAENIEETVPEPLRG